jgi:hypothetical protein
MSFDSLFPYVDDYFDSGEPPDSHYMFLPQYMPVSINAGGFSGTGGTVKLSGLIEIRLQQRQFCLVGDPPVQLSAHFSHPGHEGPQKGPEVGGDYIIRRRFAHCVDKRDRKGTAALVQPAYRREGR